MIGSKKIIINIFFLGVFFNNTSGKLPNMEIGKIFESNLKVKKFVQENLKATDSVYRNPIFPYKVNYVLPSGKSISFCKLPVLKCWAFVQQDLYTFFLLIKNDSNIISNVSREFGDSTAISEVEINDGRAKFTSVHWDKERLNIILKNHFNIEDIASHDDCSLIVIGNMEYSEFVTMPIKGF